MTSELPTRYDPAEIQAPVYRSWLDSDAFRAVPDRREGRYVIMMPLPNVTGALHMGHAMDNVMQDLLIRWRRMEGDNTLWQAGTDHAGIATQAVVEKRLFELEGKTRHDIGRDALVRRIWDWKEEYQVRIVEQQQQMGCSCDWQRQRFTMDGVCAAAVRETFFRMFRDGLIYRGSRLVNWDCHLQTAVSDDEVIHETVAGHFWHLRYPVIDPRPGEPDFVVVATTRPETMLGDTAVACHPDPRGELTRQIENARARSAGAPARERPALEREVQRLEERVATHLPFLERLKAMAEDGRKILLPLLDREIPLILDEWARPGLGSGCVKITPGHDPNDYEVWRRHEDEIGAINILQPDGTLSANAGPYRGLDRFEARKRVVQDLETRDLLEAVEDREIEIGHSDRSKTPIEPFLSQQWFVRMADVDGGIVMGRGTPNEFRAAGLAQAAMDAVAEGWSSPTGRRLEFHPDPVRYRNTYRSWLAEKRDWCISRQLWWGHRIPVWRIAAGASALGATLDALPPLDDDEAWLQVTLPNGDRAGAAESRAAAAQVDGEYEIQVCLRDDSAQEHVQEALEAAGLSRDPDVLDTWFSSALWPHSTLGWPDPESAPIDDGQRPLATNGQPSSLEYYYPGSCLVTGRDIITLWVARMVLTGLYNLGDVPFTDCFIHANIQDGRGVRMSKSLGNGVDPLDIIERYGADAMRFVLCDMQTGLQDIRLPVQAISPFDEDERLIELTTAKAGPYKGTYVDPKSGQPFDCVGHYPDLPQAKVISDRFEIGRNFCNKLWNAARFTLMNVGELGFRPLSDDDLDPEDRWILSRLTRTTCDVTEQLQRYNPSAAAGAARDFVWSEFCDWYLELVKPRMKDAESAAVARQVLACVLDQQLRLLHPFVPFITEAIWQRLQASVPERGIDAPLPSSDLILSAAWPSPDTARIDEDLERRFDRMRDVIRAIRDLRREYDVPPSKRLQAIVKAGAPACRELEGLARHVRELAVLDELTLSDRAEKPRLAATQVAGDIEIHLSGVVDPAKERQRLTKQREKLQGQVRAVEGKLANESFVNRAPGHVVDGERRRLDDLRKELTLIEQNLGALD